MKKNVLIIAPGRKTRGGITSVISSYETTTLWKDWKCFWIETYNDKNTISKFFYFLKGIVFFLIKLPDSQIIHIHLSWSTSAFRKFPYFLISKLFKKKIIIHLHSGSEKVINGGMQRIYKLMFLYADKTIVLSKCISNELQKKYKFRSLGILYNPCCSTFHKDYTKNIFSKFILFAGTINKNKGYKDLLNAFSLIAKDYPQWKVIFAGNGEIEEGLSLAQNLGIEKQIEFRGWVSGKEKDELFKTASVFCLPSYAEGFPMAVLDAWAYGLPVVTTNVGGLADILENNKNALVFNPGDVKSLAEHLDKLINDSILREKLSDEGIKLRDGLFKLENIVKIIDHQYSELVQNNLVVVNQ